MHHGCAGITPSSGSGFVEVEADDCVTMVQLATQKCLEKEALCNEFYLQLIKQTTDQPGTWKVTHTAYINMIGLTFTYTHAPTSQHHTNTTTLTPLTRGTNICTTLTYTIAGAYIWGYSLYAPDNSDMV